MEKPNLVVDLGGTRVRAAVADAAGQLRGKAVEATDHSSGPESVLAQIVSLGEQALRQNGLGWDRLRCLLVASPGPLDPQTGIVYAPPNMPGWGEVPLGPRLEERTGLPVRLVNDADAGALGEFHFGAGRGSRNLVYLTISTGIGGGVVVEGKLLRGSSGSAGEIGHMTIDRHGPICKCGNVGCLEIIASGTAIGRRLQEALDAGQESVVREWLDGRVATAEDAVRGALAGDPLATAIFTDAAEAIGNGVVNSLHIFNPDVVALGGGVTQAGPLLFDTVRRVADRYALPGPRAAARIVPAELGEDVGLMGAAAVALHDCP